MRWWAAGIAVTLVAGPNPGAQPAALDLVLPTDNDALFANLGPAFYQYIERDYKGEKSYPWEGGQYGFVRDPVETSAKGLFTPASTKGSTFAA